MAAKHKATKKTAKRTVASKVHKALESAILEQATVIPNNSFQPIQPVQPIVSPQPTQPPIQPAQPIQPVQQVAPMQTVPMPSSSQPMPVGETSAENSTTQPVEQEPEIKMGTEDRLATDSIDGKATGPASPPQITTESNQNQSGEKKNVLLPILVIVLLGIAVLGGLFLYRQNFSKKIEKIKEVSLSPTPIEKVTPKPLDLSKFKIEILNGSGIEGQASSQKTDLESMGFVVAAIGNADNGDYTTTLIQTKKDVDKAFLDKLRTVLEESFEVSTEELDEDAKTDVVIIIGSKKTE